MCVHIIHMHVHVAQYPNLFDTCTCTRMHLIAEQEYMEEMQPFTEEDLSILYPNAQLDTQSVLVDTFIRVS